MMKKRRFRLVNNGFHAVAVLGIVALFGGVLSEALARVAGGPGTVVEGRVVCGETGRDLSLVHVYPEKSGGIDAHPHEGTITSRDGSFRLVISLPDQTGDKPEELCLRASRMGYRNRCVAVVDSGERLEIVLEPVTMHMDEVVIESARRPDNGVHHNRSRHAATTGEFLDERQGVGMIKRANFGWEPSVRGLSAGRVSVLIDDIEMVPACVDRMDPVTSYVETENLEKVNISRGAADLQSGNRPGGSLNMITTRPGFDRGFFGTAGVEGRHNARQQRMHLTTGYSGERTAIQSAFTYREAGNYTAGGGEQVAGSGYRKGNLKVDLDRRFGGGHTGRLTWIGDLAYDIGYPGLIMDTDEARSHFLRYEHEWRDPLPGVSMFTVKPYHTRVDHWMDDYNRDVTGREVMPDMYMPMYGNTRTTGIHLDALVYSGDHMMEAGLQYNRLDAFADMYMEPLDPDVAVMYLLNLGDVEFHTIYGSGKWLWLPGRRWSLSAGTSLEWSTRDIHHETARRVLRAENSGVPLSGRRAVWSGSVEVTVQPADPLTLRLHLSDSGRMPSHIEQYGYYIYNPVDGYFYHGNPGLSPERSTQAELSLTAGFAGRSAGQPSALDAGLEAGLFVSRMRDFIDGTPVSEMFKRYVNYRSALLAGGELNLFLELPPGWRAEAGAAYVRAENRDLGEPLPMIPPLEGHVALSRTAGPFLFDGRVRLVAAQHRVADRTTREAPSEGYMLADLSVRYRFGGEMELYAGASNLFDVRYREHTSPGQMPGPGRDLYVRLRYEW